MKFIELSIKGVYLIEITKIADDRGFFGRAFCMNEFKAHGLKSEMVQVNVSSNPLKGTLRGLHMQTGSHQEAKLVRCTRGSIYDVAVDMRQDSKTYLQAIGVTLDAAGFNMLYVPQGCAHGYLTLEDNSDVMYQVSAFYSPGSEVGFRWNDPAFSIEWPQQPVLISVKDQNQPLIQSGG